MEQARLGFRCNQLRQQAILLTILDVETAFKQQQQVAAGSGVVSTQFRAPTAAGLLVSAPASSLLQGCSDDGMTFSFCTIASAPQAQVVASMPARFCGTPTLQLHTAKRTVRGHHAWDAAG